MPNQRRGQHAVERPGKRNQHQHGQNHHGHGAQQTAAQLQQVIHQAGAAVGIRLGAHPDCSLSDSSAAFCLRSSSRIWRLWSRSISTWSSAFRLSQAWRAWADQRPAVRAISGRRRGPITSNATTATSSISLKLTPAPPIVSRLPRGTRPVLVGAVGGRPGRGRVIDRVMIFAHALAELANGTAKIAADVAYPLGAENQQNDQKNDQDLGPTDTRNTHGALPLRRNGWHA